MTAPEDPSAPADGAEGDDEAVVEVRVGWYAYQGHPHYAHSLDEARALIDHGHVPVDDATAAQAVADMAELVVVEPEDGHDEEAFNTAVVDEAPAQPKRTRRTPQREE